jgi:Siphovirus ReqiPepy6 Gp37-like protein
MELYTIDPTLENQKVAIIENYESFIWTDRYSSFGDLTLVVEPTLRTLLAPGVLVRFDESPYVMEIESAIREEDATGKSKLTVKGKSLENILNGRAAKLVLTPATWDITGTPGAIVLWMVNRICVAGVGISANDVIPELTVRDLTGGTTTYTVSVKAGTLYERVKEICDTFDLGFRLIIFEGTLHFDIYVGVDRTEDNGVVFSEALDNLSQASYLVSKEKYKTTAYVFSANGSRIVSATGMGSVLGLSRKVILVDATDITTAAGAPLNAALDQRGRDALSACQVSTLFDGVANPNGMYRYNTHFFLGDIVALIGDDGEKQSMRVTEHIWSDDATGFSSYPTLSVVGGV